jgi:class 3 adenylate cyclase
MVGLLNLERTATHKTEIRIGVGIATGEMVAGYTGTQERATYTCIGDTVNLAARLEAHTKLAQRAILIDPATCHALDGRIAVEALGPALFHGKSAPVDVYAVKDGNLAAAPA